MKVIGDLGLEKDLQVPDSVVTAFWLLKIKIIMVVHFNSKNLTRSRQNDTQRLTYPLIMTSDS